MESICAIMVVLQRFELLDRGFQLRVRQVAEAREERVFLVGGMLGRSVAEVTQRGFKCGVSIGLQGLVEERASALERCKEHFNAPVTVGEQSGRIRKAVSCAANLYWHVGDSQIIVGR